MESVLREVCDGVLTDPTVSRETLKNRAVGLKIIGMIYQRVKSDVTPQDIPIPVQPSSPPSNRPVTAAAFNTEKPVPSVPLDTTP